MANLARKNALGVGLLFCILLARFSSAAVVRFSLGSIARIEQLHYLTKRSIQQPIIGPTLNSKPVPKDFGFAGSSASNELTKIFTHDLVYFTEIGIGTPPQRFQVLIDISSPETFVTSVECESCTSGDVKYDSSRSHSSEVNGTYLEVDYGHIFASGNMTLDTFDFNGFQVKNQPFLEAKVVESIGVSWDDMSVIHGIAGLTPSSAGSVLNNPSPFMSMVEQNVLDRNLFSMRLRKPRELMIGAINHELFTGDLVRIPLTNRTGRYAVTGRWQVDPNYLTLGSEPGIRMSLAGWNASFSTGSAFIFLPDRIVENIWQDLEFEDIMFMPPSVACEQRHMMPNIVFCLGGRNFTLTPYDYTFEWPIERSRTRCVSAIMPSGVEQCDKIVLGSAFLQAFYSVFDLDTNSLGCKSRPFLPFALGNQSGGLY
ncbi:Vacuolar protease A [Pseudocyphellaria aurata]|nr:Vacuolar protease A [Pseudocyphellaria aurata]